MAAESRSQGIKEAGLSRKYPAPGVLQVEPGGTIHLRKLPPLTGSRGPFHGKGVAAHSAGVDVPSHGPGIDLLTAGLAQVAQIQGDAIRREPGFFVEFAPRRRDRFFALLDLAFGNRPRTEVFVRPEWPPRMHEKHLQPGGRLTIEQETSTLHPGATQGRPVAVSDPPLARARILARSRRPLAPHPLTPSGISGRNRSYNSNPIIARRFGG